VHSAIAIVLLVLTAHRARTCLSTHDTASHTLRNIRTGLVGHVPRKVDKVVELRDLGILIFVNVTLELGRDGRLDGNTLSL